MRPIRLEVEGFTSFRERTSVDFTDAELFAFVGPTGAGKSSLIDAMVFALYGTVPRYDDARLVGSVINQRSSRALVDFEFAIGDAQYRIVREVRRVRSGGGTTKEARIERLDAPEVLFDGDAKQLTARVEKLLGLTAEQFTKCVVLPQGEFQRFLHDKPRVRQDLLVQLLGLEIYGRIGELARQRQKVAVDRLKSIDEQLEELAGRLDQEATLRERVDQLTRLRGQVGEVAERLEITAVALASARTELDRIDEQVRLVSGVARPDDLDDVAEAVAELDDELATLVRAEQRHQAEETEAERLVSTLPRRSALEAELDRVRQRTVLLDRIKRGESLLAGTVDDALDATNAAERAAVVLAEAEEALDRTRTEHAAAHLAGGLQAGDPCPVCHRPIDDPPSHEGGDIEAAEKQRDEARLSANRAAIARDEAVATQRRFEIQLGSLHDQHAAITEHADEEPSPQGLQRELAKVEEAEEALERARLARKAAVERRATSESRRKKIAKLETSAWQQFDELRDALAVLQPPAAERDDLPGSWAALVDWAAQTRQARVHERTRAADAHEQADAEQLALVRSLDEAFVAADLPPADGGYREVVAAALARAEAELERLDEVRELAEKRSAERAATSGDEQVAGELGNLLKANAFEKWLLDEAMSVLVAGASRQLEGLSRGQYSLAVDPKSGGFLVIDHYNADEPRSARTLSGGETFLASLALALALAEQITELASDGSAKLESIFLDEGFGTLDAETLEVVAAAIEELQAGGLVVGLVSHVAELADRVPVRFEVRKGPQGSSVERVAV